MPTDRILVVEDTDDTRHHLSQLLTSHGYHVDEACDGLAALRKASTIDYSAILLDLVMPHVDGWQFRDTQLRHPGLASVPTIVITRRALRDVERYALRTPHIVPKPFDDDALLAVLRRACGTVLTSMPAAAGAPALATSSLLWSRRGEVACAAHAPASDAERWTREGWAPIPRGAGKDRITYQCQHCPGPGGPIQRRPRTGRSRGGHMTIMDKLEIGLKEDAPFRKDNLPDDQVRGEEVPAGPGRSPVVPAARGDKTIVPDPGATAADAPAADDRD